MSNPENPNFEASLITDQVAIAQQNQGHAEFAIAAQRAEAPVQTPERGNTLRNTAIAVGATLLLAAGLNSAIEQGNKEDNGYRQQAIENADKRALK